MASSMKTAGSAVGLNNPSSKGTQNGVITNNATSGPAVNRKKQKRRQKQAAGIQPSAQRSMGNDSEEDEADYLDDYAAQPPGVLDHPLVPEVPVDGPIFRNPEHYSVTETGGYGYSELDNRYAYDPAYAPPNGTTSNYDDGHYASVRRSTKKKRGNVIGPDVGYRHPLTYPRSAYSHLPHGNPPPRPISEEALRTVQRKVKDPIWDTSTSEERARIKEFWLALGENQRRSLVKIEKEAVLRKMKEQQKHSCSCTVCGRKRTAIEEELEVLYDAYYEELEQFANNNPNHGRSTQSREPSRSDRTMLPPPRTHATSRSGVNKVTSDLNPRKASRGRIQELPDDADESTADAAVEEEEYDTQEDYDAEDPDDDAPNPEEMPPSAKDFFTFGNSLTVQGGILTVADDLLKNDGQKFIDMMEQLAERRMQREDISQYPSYNLPHAPLPPAHHHSSPSEDEYDDEDEEDDYGSEDDDYEEEDDTDTMTEDQRMQEGRRMFQIFAARMFEQRVLTAYREKVALERQEKLIEELEADKIASTERNLKKARDAEKKKQKKTQQKQAKAEEKAKKEEAKAAEEAALRAAEEKRQEELKVKREEQRKKKEAERKAMEEEKQRKEAEKLRRQQEERERQQEVERKSRELKAEEKKKRDEVKRKERDEKEAKEKERKAQEEKQRLEREEQIKADKDAKERSQPQPDAAKRPSVPTLVALPPGLKPTQSSGHASPQAKVAAPVLPKAPVPIRPRETTGRVSNTPSSQVSAPRSPDGISVPKQATPPRAASTQFGPQQSSFPGFRTPSQQMPMSYPAHASPLHTIAPPPGMHQQHLGGSFSGLPQSSMNGFPNGQGPMAFGAVPRLPIGQPMPMYSPHVSSQGPLQRPFLHNGHPPGMSPVNVHAPSRPYISETPPGYPSTPIAPGSGSARLPSPRDALPGHSRKASIPFLTQSHESTPTSSTQPISRPAPIKRPASVKPLDINGHKDSLNTELENLSNHLGSSALLDDNDEPLPMSSTSRRVSAAPRNTSMGGSPFDQATPYSLGGRSTSFDNWGPTPIPFSSSSYNGPMGWGSAQGTGWSNPGAFYGLHHRSNNARPITVRLLATQACKTLSASNTSKDVGFVNINDLLRQVNSIRQMHEAPVELAELSPILETEGDSQNGGGTFLLKREGGDRKLVKWEPDAAVPVMRGTSLSLGEIGSPIPGNSVPFGIIRGF